MPAARGIDADVIMQAVCDIRDEHHACTVGAVRDHLGISHGAAHHWVNKLLDQGVLVKTSLAGSLRPAQ